MTTQHEQKQIKESLKNVEDKTSIVAIKVIGAVMILIEIARIIM